MTKRRILIVFSLLLLALVGCKPTSNGAEGNMPSTPQGDSSDLGDDDTSFGDSLDKSGAYDGYFDGDDIDINVEFISGTTNAYTLVGNVLTFSNLSSDSVYSISGKLNGNIIIDIGDDYKLDLELHGLSLVSETTNPITILSGDKVTLTAKKDYQNYIYDNREVIDESDETLYSGAIHSKSDLEISGKGSLSVISENNNGIHSKDDLKVKNLTLMVACLDNALKGNDSVTIEGGNLTLIASKGDGIKTTNTDISEKGNQRGTISITGGTCEIYAACDGIDAAYNVIIDDETTNLSIYTDKYSNYSSEVTENSESLYYIRFASKNYSYSIKYYNSDDDYLWVNAEYHSSKTSSQSMGRPGQGNTTYYYYSFPKMNEYSKFQFFIYADGQVQGQDTDYAACSDLITPNTAYDTIAISNNSYSWTNYSTSVNQNGFGGQGGMNEGNSDKSDYSTKGIKAANEIVINAGTINIKSYDDAIHANKDTTLENGASPLGNVTINGGNITIYSNDDGIHADNKLIINNGTISISNSYEGLEGYTVEIINGYTSIIASDDGVNSTATSGEGIVISGGINYIYCSGDGIDSNSRTSYSGIVFNGGKTIIISNSSGNSAIDTEAGYKYVGGYVVAIMPSGGMTSEATHTQSFSSVATNKTMSLKKDNYLTITVDGSTLVTIEMPLTISGKVIFLGSSSASYNTESSSSVELDNNGVAWN